MRRHGGASGKFTTTVWSFSSDVGDLLNSAGGLLGRLLKATVEPPTRSTFPPPIPRGPDATGNRLCRINRAELTGDFFRMGPITQPAGQVREAMVSSEFCVEAS